MLDAKKLFLLQSQPDVRRARTYSAQNGTVRFFSRVHHTAAGRSLSHTKEAKKLETLFGLLSTQTHAQKTILSVETPLNSNLCTYG